MSSKRPPIRDRWGYWRYYCWLCEQWTHDRGPWCDLYKGERRNDVCYWDAQDELDKQLERDQELEYELRDSD